MTTMGTSMIDVFGPSISTYTRADALADGTLVEASSELLNNAGIKFPVAYTEAVFADVVEWTEHDDKKKPQYQQDATGREWDVLWILRTAIRQLRDTHTNSVTFRVQRIPRPGRGGRRIVALRAEVGPGDHGEPVITVMQPDES